MANKGAKIPHYLSIFSLVSISFLVYLNAMRNGFVWDDMVLIADNEGLQLWGNFLENFARDFFATTDDTIEFKYGYYRPVISISYMADYALWGLNPGGYHLSNVIFHAISGILVYLIVNELFEKQSTALVAALLFACHPVHTESVTWISGRTDVIAAMFFLLAFYLHQKAMDAFLPANKTRKRGRIFYVSSLASFAVAMLCKEMAATLPLLTIACTCYFSGWKGARRWIMPIIYSIPYFLILLVYGIVRFVILRIATVVNPGGEEMRGVYPTAISFVKTIWFYFYKLVFPEHLSAYIQNRMSFSITDPAVLLSVLGLAVWIFFIVWLWKRWAGVSFMMLFYLVSLFPLSNFVRISAPWDMGFVMAERFLYIPSVGFCGFVALLLTGLWEIRRQVFPIARIGAVSLLIALLVFYSGSTLLRNRDWVDEKTFFLKTLPDAPEAALLHHALGNVYVREEDYVTAIRYYEKSLELYPLYHAAYNNIGTIYSKNGLLDQAIEAFKKAISINPDYVQAHFNLGTMYYQKGMATEAYREFKKVLGLSKNYVKAHNNLGIIYAERGQFIEAVAEFEEVLKHNPDNEKARNNLAIIREEMAKKASN